MHLSKLTLNPKNKSARRDTNPYEMHRTLARVLAPHGTCLWRLEETTLLVQSQTQPDWSLLEPGYLAAPSQSKTLDLGLFANLKQPLRFRLCANPTVTKFDAVANKNKRHGIQDLTQQLEWLKRQGEKNGFEILGAMVSFSERQRIRKPSTQNTISLQATTFDGHLRVTNPDVFAVTLATGLGHSKALGLGLLSVAAGR